VRPLPDGFYGPPVRLARVPARRSLLAQAGDRYLMGATDLP
jgi:hypothetical protein